MKAADISSALATKYKIHVPAMTLEGHLPDGVRITPNVYTSTKDLDMLVMAIDDIAKTAKSK